VWLTFYAAVHLWPHPSSILQDLAVYESTFVGLQGLAAVLRLFFLSCG
jgi:hypothetical protein